MMYPVSFYSKIVAINLAKNNLDKDQKAEYDQCSASFTPPSDEAVEITEYQAWADELENIVAAQYACLRKVYDITVTAE